MTKPTQLLTQPLSHLRYMKQIREDHDLNLLGIKPEEPLEGPLHRVLFGERPQKQKTESNKVNLLPDVIKVPFKSEHKHIMF